MKEECYECGERHTLRPDGLCPCQGCGRGVGPLGLLDGLCQECDPEGRGRPPGELEAAGAPNAGSTPPDVCACCNGASGLEPTCRHRSRVNGPEVPTCPYCCPRSCPKAEEPPEVYTEPSHGCAAPGGPGHKWSRTNEGGWRGSFKRGDGRPRPAVPVEVVWCSVCDACVDMPVELAAVLLEVFDGATLHEPSPEDGS